MAYKECDRSVTFQKKLFLHSAFGAKILRIASVLCATFLLSSCLTSSVRAERNNVITTSDFEQGNITPLKVEGCCATVVSNNVRAGSKAVKVTLDSSKSSRTERAEMKLSTFPSSSERWVGISVFIPKGSSTQYQVLNQFARMPGSGEYYGATFQLIRKGDKFVVHRYRGATENGTPRGKQVWEIGPAIENQWLDFVYHYKASSSSTGIFEMWMNGSKKIDYKGPTADDRNQGPYFKFGVYVGVGHKIDKPTSIYFDELRVGDERATYQDVAPSANLVRVADAK
jgi:hypothetical protein